MELRIKLRGPEPLDLRNPVSQLSGANGVLTIQGTTINERIEVLEQASTHQLIVEDSGRVIGVFASAQVGSLVIDVIGGNNVVEIAKNVMQPVVISGGDGNNLFIAGGGPTTLIGGSGTNKLEGGSAANTIESGSGSNLIVGGSGANTINATAGTSQIQRVAPTDSITASPSSNVVVSVPSSQIASNAQNTVLTTTDVNNLLSQASMASPNDSAIIAVVDRNGRILGVRVESGVSSNITGNTTNLVFAVDGAVALARTAAYFSNDQAPLTSRTVGDISQSTITQREVEGNPDLANQNSVNYGPGYVAPVQIGGHFPPGVANTAEVDLFEIEHTNRDDLLNADTYSVNGVDEMGGRFNTNPAYQLAPLQAASGNTAAMYGDAPQYESSALNMTTPLSYGVVSGLLPSAVSRGIATLPGGIPIYKNYAGSVDGELVGGIGVFFPGQNGYADSENSSLSAGYNPALPDLSLEAEYMAFAAVTNSGFLPIPVPLTQLPNVQINLAGVELTAFGPSAGENGIDQLLSFGRALGTGPVSGTLLPVDTAGDPLLNGLPVASGWLIEPHNGVGVTAAQAIAIIQDGITQANQTRAQIRLPDTSPVKMVFAVTDKTGAVIALYRMPDATVFSIDVAVAKARNVNYYDDPTQLHPIDQVPGIPVGTAFTNRTIRYLALPNFPSADSGAPPGPFSILNDPGIDPKTGLMVGPKLPPSDYTSVDGYDSFHPNTNFRQTADPKNQNGIVFFPGSSPLYVSNGNHAMLIGGLGVSGDGVNQDDVVTASGVTALPVPSTVLLADQTTYKGVALPYVNYDRNPDGGTQ